MYFLIIKELCSKVKIYVLILIGCKLLYRVVCVGLNEVFVFGNDKFIICIDIYGIIFDRVIIEC